MRAGQRGPGPRLGSQGEEGGRRQGTGQRDERQAQGDTGDARDDLRQPGPRRPSTGRWPRSAPSTTPPRRSRRPIGSAFAEAEGVARGNPKLKSGTPVSISVVATDFAGQYTLTQTRHDFDARGYRTRFIVSGRQERSLLGLTSNGTAAARGRRRRRRIDGVVVAIVTNNDDPDKLARVKLKFPWLSDDYESDWARMTQIGAGPDSGAVFLPEVGRRGARRLRVRRRPPARTSSAASTTARTSRASATACSTTARCKRRGFVSRKGHRAIFLDDPAKSGIALLTGDSKLRIALKETGTEIHVFSDGKIEIEATSDITIKSTAGISIEANGQLTLKGQGGVKIESGGVVDIDGSMIQLN